MPMIRYSDRLAAWVSQLRRWERAGPGGASPEAVADLRAELRLWLPRAWSREAFRRLESLIDRCDALLTPGSD
jgi:hypothetical protein